MARKDSSKKWTVAIIIIVVLFFIGLIFSGFVLLALIGGGPISGTGNIAVIPIKGVILTERARGFGAEGTSSTDIVAYLKQAEENTAIKAIVLEINSPGGSAVASAEIADKIKSVRQKKPVISVIREIGASGAYWVASSTDRIYAHRNGMVGSIGVIGSYVEFAGLMEQYNLTYRRLVAGKFKDTGSPFRKLQPEEEAAIQHIINLLYSDFIDEVSANRNLSRSHVEELATGFVYTGKEALSLGLVDELGGKDDATKYLETKLGIKGELTEYQKILSISDILGGVSAEAFTNMGQGIGERILATNQNQFRVTV